jgi:hypothetical protein
MNSKWPYIFIAISKYENGTSLFVQWVSEPIKFKW